jgi:hypothetical protein
MTHTTTSYPNPPYTYNDYRITYNEKCFFYNGGFDLVCLAVKPNRGGVSGVAVGKLPKSFPTKEMIDLVFKVCIQNVNEQGYKEEEFCEIKKYSFEKKAEDVVVKTTDLKVKRKIITISTEEFGVKPIEKILSSSNPIKVDENNKIIKTNISSSFQKLKTHVSSSLYFKNPKKFKVNSSIIKNNNKDKK